MPRAGLNVVEGAILKLVVSGEPLSAVDGTALRETGRRWTAVGIDAATQEALVVTAAQAAYRFLGALAHRTSFSRRSDKEAAIHLVNEALLAASSSVQLALASGTLEARVAASRSVGVSLVDRVLAGVPAAAEELLEAGLREPCGLLLVVAEHPGPSAVLEDVAGSAAETLGGLRGGVRPDPIPHVAVLATADDAAAWRQGTAAMAQGVAEAGCVVVILPRPCPFRMLSSVYDLCRESLAYTGVLPSPSPLLDAAELDMCAMLFNANENLRSVVFERVLGPLLARPELFHSLDALVVRGKVRLVSGGGGRPHRSATRDVGRILEITGYDWNEPRDRFKLTLVTHLRWVAAVSVAQFSEAAWGPMPKFSRLRRRVR